MLKREEVERYAWADHNRDLSWTLGVVKGLDRDGVIRAYGGDPEQETVIMAFNDADVGDELGVVSLVHVRQEGPHVLMIENNGWLGTSGTEVAKRSSMDNGHFIAAHWDVNSNTWLTEARNGELLANFEPVYLAVKPGEPLAPPRLAQTWETYPDWIHDVEFVVGSIQATMLAVVERQTGLAFDREWLDEPMPTYRISYPTSGDGRSGGAQTGQEG